MIRRLYILLIIPIFLLSLILFIPFSAFAEIEGNKEYINNSFRYLEEKQWQDAIKEAKKSRNHTLVTLAQWQYLLDIDSGADFYEIDGFIRKHPDWPEQKKLQIRAETSLADSPIPTQEIISWFENREPITGIAKFLLADAIAEDKKPPLHKDNDDKIKRLIREAWRDGDFTIAQEELLLKKFPHIITKKDDIERTDRLVWEGKAASAERMFSRIGDEYTKLYQARIALQKEKQGVSFMLLGISSRLKNDSGLIYDRMVYKAKRNNDEGVVNLLLSAPKKVPYPEKWWKYRETQIREAINDNNLRLAEKLLNNHAQEKGSTLADANWLKGWFLLEHKNKPKEAYKIFYRMFSEVKYPVSKSRAAYWAGVSAKKAGDIEAAKSWFNTASAYPTTFYGQLASALHYGTSPLHIPATPAAPVHLKERFNSRSVVKAAKLCMEFGRVDIAEKLINHIITDSNNSDEVHLAAELGSKAAITHLSVRGAKKALNNNVVLLDSGYPVIKTPENLTLPRELVFAITRQESEFNNKAKSPAGAMGMMQLLPATARETAKRNDISYSTGKLYDAEYNLILGSLYLEHLIEHYDGSIVMAVAAYNAGMGNVYKWKKKIGMPEKNVESAIRWIESIPFAETRNYVQRVLENLQVYRYIEAQNSVSTSNSAKLLLLQDLEQ